MKEPKKRSLLAAHGAGGFETPFDMLTGCHERIRTFTAVAERVATMPAPPEQIAEACARLGLYFGTALPLHEQDEEVTLYRGMFDAAVPGTERLFMRLRDEHRAIELVLARLLPRWELLARSPERIAAERAVLEQGAGALAAAFEPHLHMEERDLFPLARTWLPQAVLGPMLAEMLARRAPVVGAMRSLHVDVHTEHREGDPR